MQQLNDFAEECATLGAILEGLHAQDWSRTTQFKGWRVNDVMVHLHFWNRAADLSCTDPDAFTALMAEAIPAFQKSGMRAFENAQVAERGPELCALWSDHARDMISRWEGIEPKTRMKWAGPDMSARSMITARQMETWAHGQEIFDLFGQDQPQGDRIRNIVFLGVNTFGWSHQVHGYAVPDLIPQLRLTSPSGEIWSFGEVASQNLIEGSAVEFAQVVTQTRNVGDTDLNVQGDIAANWMAIAQCFAGPPETPPARGARFRIND